jgi:membrane-associated phospholipid phosphatase
MRNIAHQHFTSPKLFFSSSTNRVMIESNRTTKTKKDLELKLLFSALWTHLKRPPFSNKRDLVFTFLPIVLWAGVFSLRPYLVSPYCSKEPEKCVPSEILRVDQGVIEYRSRTSYRLSDWTQNSSAVLAVGTVFALHGTSALIRYATPTGALIKMGTDSLLLLQTTLWNGFFTEFSKTMTQRPRPVVYQNVARDGGNQILYSSFYSGHTSFAAAINAALFFILLSRGAGRLTLLLFGTLGIGLTLATGLFRVWSAQHFYTDVVAGALFGVLVAFLIAITHRPRQSLDQPEDPGSPA